MHQTEYLCKIKSQKTDSTLAFLGACIEAQFARLVLEDGTEFVGRSFGYPQPVAGEIVFSTGMTGYPEALTDPSFYGQILVLTFPLVGNYGMPPNIAGDLFPLYYESLLGHISALVVEDYSAYYAHHQAETSLAQWLYNQKIPAITGIDTRSLTRRIRSGGSMPAKIVFEGRDIPFTDPNRENLVPKVSIREPQLLGKGKKRVAVLDCGSKFSILNELVQRDMEILRLPWNYPLRDEQFDGLLISSGPGDPEQCSETIVQTSWALENNIPTFGICLGHQIMALATGGSTFKMKYGHRGQNQPVQDTQSGRAYITSQNHGYAVKTNKLPQDWSPLFINLNDQSCEGLIHKSGRFFSTQFHPEASPGPVDTRYLFDRFEALL